MSFRPSALAYALVILLVWAACLGVALGRAELFFMAVPLLVPLLHSRPDDARVDESIWTPRPARSWRGTSLS